MSDEIVGILCDIDGSLVRQGGPMDPRVAAVLAGVQKIGVPVGVATGKNADYARGLSAGAGFHWNYVSAESGAQFMWLVGEPDFASPPDWRQRENLEIGLSDLAQFRDRIGLDPLRRTFVLRRADNVVHYRPELKESIITLFPIGRDLEQTQEWLKFFEEVVETYDLHLTLKRHVGDGCIDVVPEGINKHLGVEAVCRLLGGAQSEQILTVVDGTNDEELAMGTSLVAVSNAVPRIKEIAVHQNGFTAKHPDGIGFVEGLLFYARAGRFGNKSEEIVQLVLKHFSNTF